MGNKKIIAGCILVVAFIACGAHHLCHSEQKQRNVEVTTTVSAGDTLWGICGQAAEHFGDDRDIREIIFQTIKLNHINPGVLKIGDKIVIPIKSRSK